MKTWIIQFVSLFWLFNPVLCLLKKKNQLLQIIESEKVIDLTLRIIVAFNYFSDPHTPHQMQILNIEKNFVENKIFFSYPLKFSEIG